MTLTNLHGFNLACAGFKNNPTADALLDVNRAGLALLSTAAYVAPLPSRAWVPVEKVEAFATDFAEIRAVVERYLTPDEITRVAGCVGYALRQELAGEDLSEPHVIQSVRAGQTVLLFGYDSTKSRRDDPDFAEAFRLAARYVAEGTPVRLTNRAGAGTKGTRLVAGLGQVTVRFAVR